MPRDYQDNKGRDDKCITRCQFPVGVDACIIPTVDCKQICKKGAEFDIAVDFDIKPNCCVELKYTKKDSCGCTLQCVWGVKVDFDCDAKVVCHPCNKPSAEFLVTTEIQTKPECHPGDCACSKKKKKKDSSSSSSSSDCDCPDCRGKKH